MQVRITVDSELRRAPVIQLLGRLNLTKCHICFVDTNMQGPNLEQVLNFEAPGPTILSLNHIHYFGRYRVITRLSPLLS